MDSEVKDRPKKRRIAPTHVVEKACAHCRAVRHKCDGGRPTCGRCARTGNACDYDWQQTKRGPRKANGRNENSDKSSISETTQQSGSLAEDSSSSPEGTNGALQLASAAGFGLLLQAPPQQLSTLILPPELESYLLVAYCTEIHPGFPLLHLPTLLERFAEGPEHLKLSVLLCSALHVEAKHTEDLLSILPKPSDIRDGARTWTDVFLPRLLELLPVAVLSDSGDDLLATLQALVVLFYGLGSTPWLLSISKWARQSGLDEQERLRLELEENASSKVTFFRLHCLFMGTLGGMRNVEPFATSWIKREEWRRLWSFAIILDRVSALDMMIEPRLVVPLDLRAPCQESEQGGEWIVSDTEPELLVDIMSKLDGGGEQAVETWTGLSHVSRMVILLDLCVQCMLASNMDSKAGISKDRYPNRDLLAKIVLLERAEQQSSPNDHRIWLLRAALFQLLFPRSIVQTCIGLLARPRLPGEPVVPDAQVLAGEVQGIERFAEWTSSPSFQACLTVSLALEPLIDDQQQNSGAPITPMFAFQLGLLELAKRRMEARGLLPCGSTKADLVPRVMSKLFAAGKTEAVLLVSYTSCKIEAEISSWSWGIYGASRFGLPGYGRANGLIENGLIEQGSEGVLEEASES